jgi:3-isopropylmalate/(R)-2-methylmalate dehydratase small subunit
MQPFTSISAIAVGLPIANIDTDVLFPAAFLKTTSREGLRDALFAGLRRNPDFPLNQGPWDKAEILITLDNLGCGSSREHAPWALLDFGIRCVIAPSFADIFYANCFKNGILPVRINDTEVKALIEDAEQPMLAQMTVSLVDQRVTRANGETIDFQIDPQRRERLLKGIDDIAQTLGHAAQIDCYEARTNRSWLTAIPADLP